MKLIITEGPEAIVFELVEGMEESKERMFLTPRFIHRAQVVWRLGVIHTYVGCYQNQLGFITERYKLMLKTSGKCKGQGNTSKSLFTWALEAIVVGLVS